MENGPFEICIRRGCPLIDDSITMTGQWEEVDSYDNQVGNDDDAEDDHERSIYVSRNDTRY